MPLLRRPPHARIVRRLQSSWIATLVSVVIAGAAAGALTSDASSSTRKWYWTESHAEAAVIAHVRIPYCRVDPSDSHCGTGTPYHVGLAVISADCVGATELRSTFRYNRFTCRIVTYNNGAEGKIAVFPVSATAFHWKIL